MRDFIRAAVVLLLAAVAPLAAAGLPRVVPVSHIQTSADGRWPVDVPVRVCALRVQFVPDNVSGTTGDGTMGSGFDSSLVIDPLPHDKTYFEDHLRFLKHYYETVAGGRLTFDRLAVFPEGDTDVYQLAFPMWHYNYNDGNDELLTRRLVELFVQSVELAQGVDFTQFDAILVFHAGVGKDFNLGYDATPFDIPSAYISEADLQRYAAGVSLPPGVTRGLILPEGENQQEALDYGIELSLNGIVVKLFGNWLGLPDLFDTRTGRSGIGRWGMMDQGSGNVAALVPALPDAWSRVFMGWETVHDVVPSAAGDTVRVARFPRISAPRVIRFPITPREYYLVENRDADADSIGHVELRDRHGRRMRVAHDGTISIESGFRVAVEASHYDFGIPGSGLLIWHIDEDVIEASLADNTVNANPDHRGVDLVEADGAQDIGREYGFASPGSGTELGVEEDAWYFGNAAHLAANQNATVVRFADRTFPSARFHDGAFTRLELTAFSRVDTVMSFVARMDGVQPGFPVELATPAEWAVADLDGDGLRKIYFLAGDSLFEHDSLLLVLPPGLHFVSSVAACDLNGDGREELLFRGTRFGYAGRVDNQMSLHLSDPQPAAVVDAYPFAAGDGLCGLLAAVTTETELRIMALDSAMRLIGERTFDAPGPHSVLNLESFPARHFVLVASGKATCIAVPEMADSWGGPITDARISVGGMVVAEPNRRSVYLPGLGYVDAGDGNILCYEPECVAPDVDWDGDGIPDGGGRWGRQDAPRENAPRFSADVSWVIDLEANGDPDLVGYSGNMRAGSVAVHSRIRAVSHYGVAYTFFPVAASVAGTCAPFLWTNGPSLHFVTLAHANGAYAYSVHRLLGATGGQRFSYRERMNIINVGPLRPQVHARDEWAYCWPNPASSESRIRVTLDYPARADVAIFDLAGRRVASLAGESSLPGPFEIIWNVVRVESGVYLARVAASGSGGSREAQIKIAVVK